MKSSPRNLTGRITESQPPAQVVGGRPVGLSTSEEGTRLTKKIASLEADIALYRSALDKSREEMQAFAYSISHDLRAPLRAIEGFSRILLEDFAEGLNPDAQRFLQHIVENTETLGSQIEDLLRFYRIGKNPPNRIPTDADAVCREVMTTFPKECAERIEIPERLPQVFADPVQLREVFTQLLANAWKFSQKKPEPKIRVYAEMAPDGVRISIQDNGIGFDPKHAEKIFQVFQRLHPTNEYSGNGIGLPIVKRVVQAHGGCVSGEGVPGEGARFVFTLPQQVVGNGEGI